MTPRSARAFVLAACLASPSVALAQGAPPTEPPPARPMMQVSLPIDLTIVGVGGAAWITTELLKSELAPSGCRWCNPPGIDASVKGALRWGTPGTAATISDIGAFGVIPLATFGVHAAMVYANGGTVGEWGTDALVILESMVVAADMTQIVKFGVGRERPFVHDLSAAEKGNTKNPADNDLSFFSGHTSFTVAGAVSSGMVATLKGYKAAPWIWGTGLSLALTTGYLRIAADKHYFTDVMTGAVVGAASGVLVPWLHRPKRGDGASVSSMTGGPMPGGGAMVAFGGVF